MREHTRRCDISSRLGGDELLHIVTHADQANIRVVVERTRAQFAGQAFDFGQPELVVTASFGVAGFRGDTAPQIKVLVSTADQALYRAKRQGGNRADLEPLLQS